MNLRNITKLCSTHLDNKNSAVDHPNAMVRILISPLPVILFIVINIPARSIISIEHSKNSCMK